MGVCEIQEEHEWPPREQVGHVEPTKTDVILQFPSFLSLAGDHERRTGTGYTASMVALYTYLLQDANV